ncbi:MAG: TolC family protein [Planctomycetota bacterium]
MRVTRAVNGRTRGFRFLATLVLVTGIAGGCALRPRGTNDERERLDHAGRPYAEEYSQRTLPELPSQPAWQHVLQRALLASGALEAAFHDWQAAVERIDRLSAFPNSNVAVGFDYFVSSERMKSFDRMTFTAGFDAMENLVFPQKARAAGRIALKEARAAGERFRATKFAVQRDLLVAWAEHVALATRRQLRESDVALARLNFETAASRVRSGGSSTDLLAAEIAFRTAEGELARTIADASASRVALNAMLARESEAPLEAPDSLPPARPLLATDAELITIGAEANPELAELALEVATRHDALKLARLAWLPDLSPTAGFTGTASQFFGAMITLPTTVTEIRAAIREAESLERAAVARLRQARLTRAGEFVATLVALRDSERQSALLARDILPAANRLLANQRAMYSAGLANLGELVESQRSTIEVEIALLESRTRREQRLAELEALAGVDFETLAPGGRQRAANKTDSPVASASRATRSSNEGAQP